METPSKFPETSFGVGWGLGGRRPTLGWGGVRWGEVRWSGLLISKLQLMSEMEDLLTFSRCHLSCGLFTMGEGAAQSLVRKDGARQAKIGPRKGHYVLLSVFHGIA